MPRGAGDDPWLEQRRVSVCAECRAPLAHDQRYCVECGARRDLLARSIGDLLAFGRGETAAPVAGSSPAVPPLAPQRSRAGRDAARRGTPVFWPRLAWPTPSAAAVAVMALLAFGVLVGAAASPLGASDASSPILVAVSPPAASAPTSAPTVAAAPSVAAPAAVPAPTSPAVTAPTTTAAAPSSGGGASTPASSKPPAIKHVFVVMLADQAYQSTFGPGSSSNYFSKTLRSQGEMLPNYYGVASGELANTIALISGQGPTPQTEAGCPDYTNLTPGTTGSLGQILGSGCVYPASTPTLASQLTAAKQTWKAYVQGIGPGQAEPACAHPTLGAADPDQAPTAANPAVTWSDPFVYFHSIIDASTCASQDVGLAQLTSDLKSAATTPSLSYVVPDACDDGSDQACRPGATSGLAAAQTFLEKLIPQITASPAYQAGGLIAITFDQAPQTGPFADSSGCCDTPAYPNVPAGAPGSAIPGGDSGASGASGPTGSSGASGPSGSAGATGITGASGASGATGRTGATGISGTGSSSSSGAGGLVETGAGGQVGLLLLSQDVEPGSVDPTLYNHFSLLRSIESIFGLKAIGYAAASGLPAFSSQVYNAGSSG